MLLKLNFLDLLEPATLTISYEGYTDTFSDTVDAGYKNTLGSSKLCSYNQYKLYNRYENRFSEDGSYIWCSYNRHPLYYQFNVSITTKIQQMLRFLAANV